MIGRQVPGLFLDAVDARELATRVRQAGGDVLAAKSPTNVVKRLEWPTAQWSLRLAPAEMVDELVPELVETQDWWLLSAVDHHVVEWTVLPEEEGVLRAGRLYWVESDFVDSGRRERPSEFLAFARRVRRLAERVAPVVRLPDGGRVRLGPSARRRHDAGALRLTWF